MPYRDDFSRLCGPLNYKDKSGNWHRQQAILDENKCLLRFFNPYVFCPKDAKLWDMPEKEIQTGFITKIEKKAIGSNDESCCFEITMVDTEKHLIGADSAKEMDEWIKNLHRVAVDPTRRQEGSIKSSIKKTLPRENKEEQQTNGSETSKPDQSPEHVSYETKIIGGVVVRRPVSKKTESDSESLSGGSHCRTMSGGVQKGIRVLKQGFLIKKGAVVRNWKKRYFKLDMTSFSYYEKDTDKEPIRSIATCDILHVRHSPSSESNKDYLFEVQTGTRTFLIQADNQEDMEDWIQKIKDATQSIQARSYSGPT